MRKFNTEGPVVARDHYCIPPLERLNLPSILELIGDKRYFVLHAPRQTGKTSVLLALRDLLNSGGAGDFRCVYVNVEAAQAVREDVRRAMQVILGELASRARSAGDEFLYDAWPDILAIFGDGALAEALTRWCENTAAPVVLLIDEIDALIGDTLIAVLRQLRARYDRRPESFPQSVVLCGVRDVRDYRIQSRAENAAVAGGSAFNVGAEPLRLGDFTEAEVRALLDQHTRETGQPFTPEALETVWRQTRGQPWLVNALCRRVCFDEPAGRDRSRAITADDVLGAQEHLILSRQVHLDQLADKLREDRVRRVVEPLLSGGEEWMFSDRDLEYVRDLGLIARDAPPRIANPIYAEIVPRELTWVAQSRLIQDIAWYVDDDGGLDVDKLLGRLPDVLPRALGALAGPFRLRRGRPAAHSAGVPAARRERRGQNRAGVRPRPRAYRPAHRLAPRGHGGAGSRGRQVRNRVQGGAQGPRADDRRRHGADGGLHGPLRGADGSSGRVRPPGGPVVGREDLPPGRAPGRPADHRLGDVNLLNVSILVPEAEEPERLGE